jgi:hypothetical protein
MCINIHLRCCSGVETGIGGVEDGMSNRASALVLLENSINDGPSNGMRESGTRDDHDDDKAVNPRSSLTAAGGGGATSATDQTSSSSNNNRQTLMIRKLHAVYRTQVRVLDTYLSQWNRTARVLVCTC